MKLITLFSCFQYYLVNEWRNIVMQFKFIYGGEKNKFGVCLSHIFFCKMNNWYTRTKESHKVWFFFLEYIVDTDLANTHIIQAYSNRRKICHKTFHYEIITQKPDKIWESFKPVCRVFHFQHWCDALYSKQGDQVYDSRNTLWNNLSM